LKAKKLAYADLKKYIWRSTRAEIAGGENCFRRNGPLARAKQIDERHANCNVNGGEKAIGSDTTYLTVVDRDGNMVSLIQSNYDSFGSGIVAPGTGICAAQPGRIVHAGCEVAECASGQEAAVAHDHSAFAEKGAQKGATRMAFGIMGGMEPIAGACAVRG